MAAKRTSRRKSSGRKKAKAPKRRKAVEALTGSHKPKKRRTKKQREATAKLVARNKARRGGHKLPSLPKGVYGHTVHTAVTVAPHSRHPVSHHPDAQTIRLHPRREVGHEFYD